MPIEEEVELIAALEAGKRSLAEEREVTLEEVFWCAVRRVRDFERNPANGWQKQSLVGFNSFVSDKLTLS